MYASGTPVQILQAMCWIFNNWNDEAAHSHPNSIPMFHVATSILEICKMGLEVETKFNTIRNTRVLLSMGNCCGALTKMNRMK